MQSVIPIQHTFCQWNKQTKKRKKQHGNQLHLSLFLCFCKQLHLYHVLAHKEQNVDTIRDMTFSTLYQNILQYLTYFPWIICLCLGYVTNSGSRCSGHPPFFSFGQLSKLLVLLLWQWALLQRWFGEVFRVMKGTQKRHRMNTSSICNSVHVLNKLLQTCYSLSHWSHLSCIWGKCLNLNHD